MTPKRKTTPLTVVNLIHCRRVRRRNLSAKGCPPYNCLPLTKIPLKYYQLFYYSSGRLLNSCYASTASLILRNRLFSCPGRDKMLVELCGVLTR
ncbi:MAG: hypothetical protein LBK82_09700 [Planctomycetaceae bacterium]|nr:hypothetical protein [Planctomycetaceae bacterium]